jgi:hypothetical protein
MVGEIISASHLKNLDDWSSTEFARDARYLYLFSSLQTGVDRQKWRMEKFDRDRVRRRHVFIIYDETF